MVRFACFAAAIAALSMGAMGVLGCGNGSGADPFVRAPSGDAGPTTDAATDGSIVIPPDIDSGANDPTLGGPCLDDGQCNDQIACTFDKCDFSVPVFGSDGGVGRCRNTPDDSQCADAIFCNGRELCALGLGCRPGPVETCQDQDSCTIDTCVESTRSCNHTIRDLDGDGDPDDHCSASHDCNDQDPDIASTRTEICGNGKDDNCNGQKDEQPCATATADTCATASAVTAPGTYAFTSVAAKDDLPLSCASAGKDVIAAVTIPAGSNKDLDLWARSPGGVIALGVQGSCGTTGSELACRASPVATRVRVRNLAPGTYAVIMKTTQEVPLELAVDFLDPTPAPTNETCATAKSVSVGVPFAVSLIDPAKDVPSACPIATGELTYSFTLAQASDLRVFATVVNGAGTMVTSLRKASCTQQADELRCRTDSVLPLFARNVPAGNYVLTVGSTSPVDATVLVSATTPTTASSDDACATAPSATINGTMTFDLDAHDDDIDDDCFEGNPDAAYALTLAQASDVLLVARFPPADTGSVALDAAACTSATRLACTLSDSPVRASKRNVPAGDYRAAITDRNGRMGSLTTLVRPTVAPVDVSASDSCGPNVFAIPSTGGYFTGTTVNGVHDYSSGCDQAGSVGAPDKILKLELTQTRRVVLDMSGSTYTTLLSVRSGATCPGTEVPQACFVGFSADRSFLDRELAAGTYWIVIDGFSGESGAFALDVRIVDP